MASSAMVDATTERVPKRHASGGAPRRTRGFAVGVGLSLAGLMLSAASATTGMWRAANGLPLGEPVWALSLRIAGGAALVLVGFCLMVLSARDTEGAASEVRHDVIAAVAGDDILCKRCGAANDHLARYCDQCGRKLGI